MAHKILKSVLPTEEFVHSFHRLCNAFIEKAVTHDAHMKNVARDPKTYVPYPAPTAHPDIMAAIVKEGDKYSIEFDIEDDLSLTLDEKKAELVAQLNEAAGDFQNQIMPPMLMRKLHELEGAEIFSIHPNKWTADQKKKADGHLRLNKLLTEAHKIQAKAEGEIHGLTEKNVDKWKIPAFPEIVK